MDNSIVSVIVPAYNIENYIGKCIDSLLRQSVKDIEIIIVDDGSTDSTPKICDRLQNDNDCVRVIHKENGGVSSARNVGIEQARGTYIAFVDGDDTVDEKMYEYLVDDIKKYKSDLIMCGFVMTYDDESNNKSGNFSNGETDVHGALKQILGIGKNQTFGAGPWNKLFLTELIRKNQILFDESIGIAEDTLFLTQYVLKCNGVFMDNRCLYNYYQRSSSAFHIEETNPKMLDMVIAWDKIADLTVEYEDLNKRAKSVIYNNGLPILIYAYAKKNKNLFEKVKKYLHGGLISWIKNSSTKTSRKIKIIIEYFMIKIHLPCRAVELVLNFRRKK